MNNTQGEKSNVKEKRQSENAIVENLELARRLKESREKSGLFQVDVAKRLNTNSSVISNYERAFRDPSTVTLKKLAVIYNVTTDYLLGLSDNPRPPKQEKEEQFTLSFNADDSNENNIDTFQELLEAMTQQKINELQMSASSIMSTYLNSMSKDNK